MSFTKKLPEWNNPGTEPPQSTKDNGWTAGSKPPADWFNWFFNLVYQALQELQQNLSNVDNTSDVNKSVSTSQAAADIQATNNAINWVKGFGLGSTLNGSATDFNDLDATGFYQLSGTAANAPHSVSGTWNVIHLKNSNNGYKTQYANYNNGAGAQTESFYFRTMTVGVWSTWKRMAGTDDNVASATKLQTSRSISLTGDATGSTSFDGSGNVSISAVLTAASVLAKLLTVDGSGSGLDADKLDGKDSSEFLSALGNAVSASKLSTPRTITAAGGATGSTSFDGTTNVNLNLSLVAAQVLASLLTVDGSGSGLDSDTVDGKHYSDITTTINNAVAALQAITQNVKLTSDTGIFAISLGSGEDFTAQFKAWDNGVRYVYIPTTVTNGAPPSNIKGLAMIHSTGTWGQIIGVTDLGDIYSNTLNSGTVTGWKKINDSASDILTKLKTVDGSGSGVDADLLDGHDSSYFLPTTGNAPTATKLQTVRTLSISGDGTASGSFDGSANLALALVLASTGVTAGTYKSVTVDSKGRVTGGANPTTLAGYGITDAVSESETTNWQKQKLTDDSGYATSQTDLNSINGTKTIALNASVTNRPFDYGTVFQISNSDQTKTQIAIDNYSGTAETRSYNSSGGWSSWVKINDSASDILTKIKTMDGPDSGLDADTLDGLHANDMQRFPLTGTDGASSLLAEGSDFNNIVTAGRYIVKNGVHTPGDFSGSWYGLDVHVLTNANGVELYQKAYFYQSNQIFYRKRTSIDVGTWTPWRRIANVESDFAALNSGSGYQKFPSGIIIQWGGLSVNSNTGTSVTFPIAFPTALARGQATMDSSSGGSGQGVGASVYSGSATGMYLYHNFGASRLIHWVAIGY